MKMIEQNIEAESSSQALFQRKYISIASKVVEGVQNSYTTRI